VADGAVDHGVTDASNDAAEHLLVDDDLDLDPLARRLRPRCGQPLLLALVDVGHSGSGS